MRLEREHTHRSVVHTDPALALVDAIIEDFGDEWVTKAMYHYRWAYQDGIDKTGRSPCRATCSSIPTAPRCTTTSSPTADWAP